MKAYIVSDSIDGMENMGGVYDLITDEGEVLASQWCSGRWFADEDLYHRRPERVKEFTERFGEFNVDFLGCDSMTMKELIALNHKWAKEHPELVG